ncbi:MAG: hypothetical protein HY611_00790 [Elusimicrobia bacterium]|nr:hypothetical protein [Elusimicrobiota bacterium]
MTDKTLSVRQHMNASSKIPTEADWAACPKDLDGPYARKNFFGKSREDGARVFEWVVIERAAELRIMPPVPFRFYMLSFMDHVMSDRVLAGDWASDAASCFLGTILEKIEKEPNVIRPIMPELLPAAEYIASHQLRYGAKVKIYGSFQKTLNRIRRLSEQKL